MKEIGDNVNGSSLPAADDDLELRLFRVMAIAVTAAVVISFLLAPWRVTTGLVLGGSLSLLNYHWMRTSIAALIQMRAAGINASSNGSRYIIRYFVICIAVIAAYKLNVVSLPATIVGLCSFVVALFVEASRQFYFAIIHREGIG
jgi:hypothetical protein